MPAQSVDKEIFTVSENGTVSVNNCGNSDISVDGTGREQPDPVDYLLSAYASDYVTALRAAARQLDVDLGRVKVDVVGEMTDENPLGIPRLCAVDFQVSVEGDINEVREELPARAETISKVGAVVEDPFKANVTLVGGDQ